MWREVVRGIASGAAGEALILWGLVAVGLGVGLATVRVRRHRRRAFAALLAWEAETPDAIERFSLEGCTFECFPARRALVLRRAAAHGGAAGAAPPWDRDAPLEPPLGALVRALARVIEVAPETIVAQVAREEAPQAFSVAVLRALAVSRCFWDSPEGVATWLARPAGLGRDRAAMAEAALLLLAHFAEASVARGVARREVEVAEPALRAAAVVHLGRTEPARLGALVDLLGQWTTPAEAREAAGRVAATHAVARLRAGPDPEAERALDALLGGALRPVELARALEALGAGLDLEPVAARLTDAYVAGRLPPAARAAARAAFEAEARFEFVASRALGADDAGLFAEACAWFLTREGAAGLATRCAALLARQPDSPVVEEDGPELRWLGVVGREGRPEDLAVVRPYAAAVLLEGGAAERVRRQAQRTMEDLRGRAPAAGALSVVPGHDGGLSVPEAEAGALSEAPEASRAS